MLLLHGGLVDDRIVVWAEKSIGSSATLPGQGAHPFSASFETIAQALTNAGCALDAKTSSRTVFVWLPTSEHSPLPSSRLLCDDEFEFEAPEKFSLWSVEAVELTAFNLVALVDKLGNNKVLTPGVVLGGEFDFLCSLAKFAAAMVVEQQFLPSVLVGAEQYHARWQPLFSPESHLLLRNVSDHMPEVVRALVSSVVQSPSDTAPFELSKSFVDSFVDQAVRVHSFDVIKYIVMSKGKYLSAHDCWLHSLCTADGAMQFEPVELKYFANKVFEWQKPLRSSEFSRFRLCFRLEEPRASQEKPQQDSGSETAPAVVDMHDRLWHVRYLLQDVKDPSLLIEARDCWFNLAVFENFSNADVHPREQLLRALGQAARLSEDVDHSLRNPTPDGFALSNSGAFNFLSKTAPALQQAGFTVLLPAWWKDGKPARLKQHGELDDEFELDGKSASVMRLEDVVKFDWQVAIAGTKLSLQELRRLSELKTPLVHIRGGWIQVNEAELKASIKFLESKAKEKLTVGKVVQQSLRGTGGNGIDIEFDTTGPLQDLLSKLQQPESMTQVSTPEGFTGALRPYQQRGLSWLNFLASWGLGACLADDMGLGKTIQTLALIQHRKITNRSGPALLICPTSVVSNWRRETERFAPNLKVMIHHGSKRERTSFAAEAAKYDMVISTYGLLNRDAKLLSSVTWSGVIMDEAQNLKNDQTQQSQAARELESGYKIALTGTPIENSLNDLFSLMEFLNPDVLGSSDDFYEAYVKPMQLNPDSPVSERLRNIVRPFILRRLKTDKSIITDLPEKMESKVYCSLTQEQVSLYSAVYKDLKRQLDGVIFPPARMRIIMGGLSRLKQVCNHPAHFLKDNSALEGRSGKLDRLVEMIDEVLQVGDKALIFTQFVEMGKLIKQHLQNKFGVEVLFLHGGLSRKARDQIVESFQSVEGPKLFILSVKAGGTGLNLTAANHVFHFDRWWNPAVENQASDRAFRIGQTKNVQVHKFITSGTLEDKVDEMIEKKLKLAQDVISADESWLAKISASELTSILRLNKEALDS